MRFASKRLSFLAVLAFAVPSARGAAPSIRFDPASPAAFVVEGIDRANLDALARVTWDAPQWSELLAVTVGARQAHPTPISGRYRVVGETLQFEPRFPIEPGLVHRATFRRSHLPIASEKDSAEISAEFTRAKVSEAASTTVSRVEPSGDVLPENLLKFYLHFSAPMSRGEAYRRVHLLDASGRPLDSPFLEIGEELWDASGMRLTLLLDPGRIKRGLRPREEDGPILEAGKSYRLVIDREWPDAEGRPLVRPFRREFRAGPPDETQPDPKNWRISAPSAGTTDPISLAFPEPLDRAMLDRAIIVRDPEGKAVAGRIAVDPASTGCAFRPGSPWKAGDYRVEVDPELEDLAGNSVARAFEVDVLETKDSPVKPAPVSLKVSIRGR